MATPAEMGLVHFNFHAGAGRNRAPAVQAFVVQGGDKLAKSFGAHGDATPNAHRDGHIDFINLNGECLPVPVQTAGTNLVMLRAALAMASTALGHGPSLAALAIKRHIQSAVIFRVRNTATTLSR